MGYNEISFVSNFGDRNMHFFRLDRLPDRKFYESSIGRHTDYSRQSPIHGNDQQDIGE